MPRVSGKSPRTAATPVCGLDVRRRSRCPRWEHGGRCVFSPCGTHALTHRPASTSPSYPLGMMKPTQVHSRLLWWFAAFALLLLAESARAEAVALQVSKTAVSGEVKLS